MASDDSGFAAPILSVRAVDVHYGRAHAVQQASLELGAGVLAVVGRNGMGKTSLCNAIAGVVPAKGSVRLLGREVLGQPMHRIVQYGVAYVPQGRRLWPSLTIEEHLLLAARSGAKRAGDWDLERVYDTFPRLVERRNHGGAQLSGGEQQMLAIARALLLRPALLVMDEPTEGLAPIIIRQMVELFRVLAATRTLSILLIEQNLQVAIDVADRVAVMVNGRLTRTLEAADLARDRSLQRRLLGFEGATDDRPPTIEQPDDSLLTGGQMQ